MSTVGHHFAARWADLAFISVNIANPGDAKAKVDAMRAIAREHGRDIQIWAASLVQVEEAAGAAQDEVRRYIEREGDPEASANRTAWGLAGKAPSKDRTEAMKVKGNVDGGLSLIGTPQEVADQITALSQAGLNGLCLSWFNFERGPAIFIDRVLPLLEEAGVRLPFDRIMANHAGAEAK